MEFGELQEIKDTICHELIHSYKGCWDCGHTGLWKQLANLMTTRSRGVYNITRLTYTSEQYNNNVRSEYKYKCVCNGCGNTFYYQRETKFIKYMKYTQGNQNAYTCAKCNSTDFDIYDNGRPLFKTLTVKTKKSHSIMSG